MNRDEILAKSRNENKNADEMEKLAKLKAASISRAVGFLLCCVIALVDSVLLDSSIIGAVCWTVYWGMMATDGWVLCFTLKKKWGCLWALMYSAFFAAFAIIFILKGFFVRS